MLETEENITCVTNPDMGEPKANGLCRHTMPYFNKQTGIAVCTDCGFRLLTVKNKDWLIDRTVYEFIEDDPIKTPTADEIEEAFKNREFNRSGEVDAYNELIGRALA